MFKVLLYVLFYFFSLEFSLSANWAQSSGHLEQNQVIPLIPSPTNLHWSARYGMVAIAVPSDNSTIGVTTVGFAYILGGDSYLSPSLQNVGNNIDLLDYTWYNGYKNDVWRASGTEWYVKGNIRLRTSYKQKIPEVYSQIKWELVSPGLLPPVRTTYDDWIHCDNYFIQSNKSTISECNGSDHKTQWSPRRYHVGAYFKGHIWILGGRAREIRDFPILSMIGGVIGPRVQDIPKTSASKQSFTTQREASVLKNDVWRSKDGSSWTLISAGCKNPQLSLIPKANDREGKYGTLVAACSSDFDCYGAEKCDSTLKTCYCPMWSGREQHAMAASDDYMFISGGFVSQLYSQINDCGPYACGDTYASNYRFFMNDVWRSNDGLNWTLISEHNFPARGGHQMLYFKCPNSQDDCLWVIGGAGGDNKGLGNRLLYNDICYSVINNNRTTTWTRVTMPWSARTGHSVVYEEASGINNYVRRLYVIGGKTHKDVILDDVWVWRIDLDDITLWSKDFTSSAYYSSGVGQYFSFQNNSPSVNYVSANSDLSLLQKFFIPTRLPKSGAGIAPSLRPYITADQLDMLHSAGLFTINDLANADLYTILKLRGFDYPQVPKSERLNYQSICDVRALAIAVVDKCRVDFSRNIYDGQQQMPWNVIPVFGGAVPTNITIPQWHGRDNYDFLLTVDDPTTLLSTWDGCSYIPEIEDVFGVNVNGIGWVSQVTEIADPSKILQELFCKQTPGPRVFHASLMFEERVYLFGGMSLNNSLLADTWYRDAALPTATFSQKPPSKSSAPWFEFKPNEPGVIFEYRILDTYKYKEIRPWTRVTKKTSVSWLNWRVGGPSNGYYTIYVRAVDPAGNRDAKYFENGNVYTWYYVSPTPWDIILEVIFGIIGICILGFIEYRRRLRKSAMERYAMKRMRRKFKALQRDVGELDGNVRFDWRVLYMENKNLGDPNARKKANYQKKKQRDRRKERRDKEKKRRDKEKERIKKKLRETKSIKDSSKVAATNEDIESDEKAKERLQRKLLNKKKYEDNEDDGGFNDKDELRFIDEEEQRLMIENQKTNRYKAYELGENKSTDGSVSDLLFFKESLSADQINRYKGMALSSEPIDPLEIQGTKQRRVFKRYKDYEATDEDPDIDTEKKQL